MRVVIASDRPVVRGGLAALAEEAGAEVVAEVDDAAMVETTTDLEPDAVLLQVRRGDDLDEIARQAELVLPAALVCLVEDGIGAAAILAAGASALAMDTTAATLRAALDAAAAGLLTTDPALAAAVEPPASARRDDAPVEELTPRELQVLQLMAQGQTNPAIARQLGISQHTVKFHVTSVLGKLGAATRAEAVARGIGLGWVLV